MQDPDQWPEAEQGARKADQGAQGVGHGAGAQGEGQLSGGIKQRCKEEGEGRPRTEEKTIEAQEISSDTNCENAIVHLLGAWN